MKQKVIKLSDAKLLSSEKLRNPSATLEGKAKEVASKVDAIYKGTTVTESRLTKGIKETEARVAFNEEFCKQTEDAVAELDRYLDGIKEQLGRLRRTVTGDNGSNLATTEEERQVERAKKADKPAKAPKKAASKAKPKAAAKKTK